MTEHYYSEKQESPLKIKKITAFLLGNELTLETASGVFSVGEVDKGTKLLIEKSEIKEKDRILDMGCGYGVVGIALAKKYPKTEIAFTDINKRAVMITKKNIKSNKIKNKTKLFQGHLYDPLVESDNNYLNYFNTILTNPPQHAGKDICFKIIEESPEFLMHKGTLQLVARHNKGGETLSKKMKEVFGNVKDIAKSGGFRVYLSEKE
ncbi:class I SAM-dependent methyltransferase [Nanoarchaeota archaeon]